MSDFVAKADPELAANAMLCAINQAAYLLKRQLESQSRDFLDQVGFTENLYAARLERRTAGKGPQAGQAFWGCSHYPTCKGIRNE